MKSYSALLLTAAASVLAENTWEQWSSSAAPAPSPAPVEVGWTDWVTTTDYKTVYETVTLPPVTVTLPPVTKTETETETVTLPPVTVVSVSGSVLTVENTVVNTVVNTATATEIQQVSVTSISVVTSAVTVVSSVSYCPPTLSGLVLCPSRTINPTFTPAEPLPSNYLWGCPPGQLCHPTRENCNFEVNPPADTYYCPPEQCLPVAYHPPIEEYLGLEDVNATCAWLKPVDDYFNINPYLFDLNFNIFDIYGQPTCTPPPPTVTVTVPTTVPVPTTLTAVTTVVVPSEKLLPTTQVVATTVVVPSEKVVPTTVVVASEVVVPTTVTVSSWIEWTTTAPAPAPVVVTSSVWDDWHSKREAEPEVSARAELIERQGQQVIAPPQCYAVCNGACGIAQSIGLDEAALCDPNGEFQIALNNVRSCTLKYSAYDNVATSVSGLSQAISYCSVNAKRSLLARQATSDTASTVEPSDFSTSSVSPSASASSVSSEASSAASSVASSASSAASAAASSASSASPGSSASSASSAAASISSSAASAASSAASSASSVASSATSAASSAATAGSKASHVQVMNSIWAFFLPILALFVRI